MEQSMLAYRPILCHDNAVERSAGSSWSKPPVDPNLARTGATMLLSSRRPARSGFTLIELLVVISIIGVLVALLLPAVQAARAAARRTQCMNNLKQVGLALANYQQQIGSLPSGYLSQWDAFANKETGPGWGWASLVLPFLEQGNVANNINFSVNISAPTNQTVRIHLISAYICPEGGMPDTWIAENGEMWIYGGTLYSARVPICGVAGSNYVGVFGIGEPGVDGEGVFFRGSAIEPRNITDGLSQTLAVGERTVNLSTGMEAAISLGTPSPNKGRGQASWVGTVAGTVFWSCFPNPYDSDGGVCRKEDGSGMTLGHTGEGHGPGDPNSEVNQFESRHGQGCFFLFCDGHVKFLNRSINYSTYKALSTRAGGEVISNDFN